MKGLVLSMITKEKIETSGAKAKELRPMIEKLVTRAKKNDLASKKLVLSGLYNNTRAMKKLFEILAPKYADRKGGYTRITKLPSRLSDGSPMSIIKFI